jgi:uncharacterized RDD family membrane protein YckC
LQSISNKAPLKPAVNVDLAAGFFRIMGAVIYDSLLLLAVLFFATALALPFNAGDAFSTDQYIFSAYLLVVSFVFYGWFWTHGGQTLGLKSWKIKLCSRDGGSVSWQQVSIRFFAAILSWACFGFGFLWVLFDKNRLSWHDRISKTRLVLVPAENSGC